jgi:ABC-2 type transport system permease protein
MVFDDPDAAAPARPPPEPIKIDETVLFNPAMRDSDFFLPGTIGMVIMLVSLSLTTGLVREKEQQTIEQLWATPLTRLALIGGKIIPCAIIAALDGGLAFFLSRAVFHLPVNGSYAGVLGLAGVFILAFIALGTLVSVISETQLQASFMNIFIFVVSICMSGFIFPIEAMPRALQPTAWLLPLTYFLDGMRGLMLKASPLRDVLGDIAALAAAFVVFSGLSLALMKKQRA